MRIRQRHRGTGPRGKGGKFFLTLFFGVFLGVGVALTWVFAVQPLQRVLAARDWVEVPCMIVSSSVREHDGDEGSTYSVAVVFRYEREGRTHTADRYKFVVGSSSGRSGKQAIVARFPAGSSAVCFVDPLDPTEAVLERGLTPDMAFGLIPLVFALVGGGGLVGVWFRRGPAPAGGGTSGDLRQSMRDSSPGTFSLTGDGAGVLEARGSRRLKFFSLLLFALFWNGVVSVFLVSLIGDWARGDASWFQALFLTPFVAIGLTMIGLSVHAGLALLNPRPRLTLPASAVAPGEEVDVGWQMIGSVSRLRRFSIELEGREEATYRRGTNTSTDRSIFARYAIAEGADPGTIAAGRARFRLPADSMHSFTADNNRIVWVLHVRGEIPRWPDIDDEFPFTVLARAPAPSP